MCTLDSISQSNTQKRRTPIASCVFMSILSSCTSNVTISVNPSKQARCKTVPCGTVNENRNYDDERTPRMLLVVGSTRSHANNVFTHSTCLKIQAECKGVIYKGEKPPALCVFVTNALLVPFVRVAPSIF